MTQDKIFWADQLAEEILAARSTLIVATGITPSGEIHIGNLREVVTADAAIRALRDHGKTPTFYYLGDTYDPLRRVYPFLDEAKYAPHVGKPLSEIPCPCDKHESYAEHFLEPFLRSLKELDITAELLRADRLYKEGRYTKNIFRALQATDLIRRILKEETGKETDSTWSPFNPICGSCGKMTGTKVTGFSEKEETVSYRCECGTEGNVPVAGGGKLTWRVDWPARWEMLGVTVEPFGKDHASRGGSYDTGVRISRDVFGYEPPFPIVYEWISLKGGGDMSSSKGNVLSIHEMLEVVPPEVLKYSVIRIRPNRRMEFDPGLPLLTLMDEYDDPKAPQRHHRAAKLAEVSGSPPVGVPFRHMVSLFQTAGGRVDEIASILARSGYPGVPRQAVEQRTKYASRWLERFAPEEVRFVVQKDLPSAAQTLDAKQKKALKLLADRFKSGATADEIHSMVYAVKEEAGITPGEFFTAIYRSFVGKDKGPRAGFFLASLDPEFVKRRLLEASEG